ncbi:hypothetical protein [Roseateles cavernae]|uniref:hypothetical protein n=1 Tax=Roseateles cavernae TaxID=3153578 RepID=UPI0032E520C9
MSYEPQADTLAGRTLQFFRSRRDEELEPRDIASKFGCSVSSVPALLAGCVANGLLVRRKDETQAWVYAAGPKLGATPDPSPAPVLAPAAGAASAPASRRSPLPVLDVAAITVRRDVQDPGRVDSRRAAYFAALDKLDAPKTAIDIDKRYRGAIAKAAQDYVKQAGNKAKRFAFRAHPDNAAQCIVLREA